MGPTILRFRVDGEPVAQPRQRHRAFSLPGGQISVQNYTPKTHPVTHWKNLVTSSLSDRMKEVGMVTPLEGPLFLVARFCLPRPKGMVWKRKPMPRQFHCGKPDEDNLAKSLKDAMTRVVAPCQLWHDDSQVSAASFVKVVSSGYEEPHAMVCVGTISNASDWAAFQHCTHVAACDT